MMDANHNLAVAWIKFHHLAEDSAARDELEWAWEQLDDLCRAQPATAWQVIQEIIARDRSDTILANIGAGPFEDLLVHHGARFIDQVESCARSNAAFKRMLGTVWKNSIVDDVWNRVRAIAPPSW
jgi:hypothetical protein